jgi:GTP-binding protein EngB required for normal cell division
MAEGWLNENHERSLTSGFTYIDDLLVRIENASAGAGSHFARSVADLSATQRQVVADYVERIRGQIEDAFRVLRIPVPPPRVRASWAIRTTLGSIEIALADMEPSRLRGYGPLGPEAAAQVERVVGDLDRTVRRLRTYLAQGLGQDLAGRLERLERAPVDLALLRALGRAVSEYGLIEYRGALEAIVDRVEADSFEVAVFGRVSSGKSSLLNAVLEIDALPVGVTPVTAVPTRVTWGERAAAEVSFEEGPSEEVPIARLCEFVSEAENPQNRKRVRRVLVRVPSPRLRAGLVFVDTPGVGSLAAAGARASYAYLPRCDLGVLVLGGASALGREDIELLRLLYESGIPAMVVVSKADLLAEPDRERMRSYAAAEIARALGLELPVHLVSAVGPSAALARAWFASELAPLCDRAKELGEASARRKLAALREGVVAALRVLLDGPAAAGRGGGAERRTRVEALALEAEGRLQEALRACDRLADDLRGWGGAALALAARRVARDGAREPGAARAAVRETIAGLAEEVRARMRAEALGARDRLREILVRMAEEVGAEVRAEDLSVDLVAQPAFESPHALDGVAIRPPRLLRVFPALAERSLTAQLRPFEASVKRALSGLGIALREWSRGAIAGLGERFTALADPFRSLARRTAGAGVEGRDRERIAADLEEIETLASRGTAAERGKAA